MTGLEPYVPEDFDAFWRATVEEADAAPFDFRRHASNYDRPPGLSLDTLTFRGVGGETLHGWLAWPEGRRACPGFLWIPPYGRWSRPPDAYSTRPDFASLSFNFFGEGPFHDEAYTPARGYFADGAAHPETWVFRRMVQNALIAVRVLQAQPEVDEDALAAMGLSQGGGMAVWLGAWCPAVRAVVADLPFLGGMPWVLSGSVHRYPLKELTDFMASMPLGREVVGHTLSYFDTVNQATRCRVPTLVTAGLKDPAVRPAQVEAIHRALAGPKAYVSLDWGHDWHPSMVARNSDWLTEHLSQVELPRPVYQATATNWRPQSGNVPRPEMDKFMMFRHATDTADFEPGETVFRAGDTGSSMYVIVEGEVEILLNDSPIDLLSEGDLFGEMALINPEEPRAATAVAKTKVRLAEVDEKRFTFMVQQTPRFSLQVMRVISTRLRKMNAYYRP